MTLHYDFHTEQNRFEFLLNVDRNIETFAGDFPDSRTSIDLPPEHDRTKMMSAFARGERTPLIRCEYGRFSFRLETWGRDNANRGLTEYVRECTPQRYQHPALIPATSIELTVENNAQERRVRIANACGSNLYVAAVFWPAAHGRAAGMTPLICEAGPDISPYCDWQPLLIPIASVPRPGIVGWLCDQDSRYLRNPSPAGSLKVSPAREVVST